MSSETDKVAKIETEVAEGQPEGKAQEDMVTNRRKELFGDCRLIEIIHLHDCLRGAISALQDDVDELTRCSLSKGPHDNVSVLEGRVAGRFKVIWSVFRAHSAAEDEFIWPALRKKTHGNVRGSPVPASPPESDVVTEDGSFHSSGRHAQEAIIDQGEYEEDHADEEKMFSEMDTLLVTLHELVAQSQLKTPFNTKEVINADPSVKIGCTAIELSERTLKLSQHLMVHLEKEENECLPLVVKHLSKSEIHDLVGQIMGKRSADTIAQIMTMAVQNLDERERLEMVKYMKESMSGTFFDRWLAMSGWTGETEDQKRSAVPSPPKDSKRQRIEDESMPDVQPEVAGIASTAASAPGGITSQTELEKMIRAVAMNQSLNAKQKNSTIQGLRDSVWRSNKRANEDSSDTKTSEKAEVPSSIHIEGHVGAMPSHFTPKGAHLSRTRRVTPPSAYYKKSPSGSVDCIWSEGGNRRLPEDGSVPLFSASEIAPTYHDGAAGSVLGCPHYARACKLRHPKSGKLYTCRLCCEQEREMPMRENDAPLDRYDVTEVMCMKCNALQPADDRCINPECETSGKPFAKYFCKLCHLYDDGSRPIFHCPYCNTCRLGHGLGIDFRHCMRCNACVSLEENDHHCIPQRLQGSCPICNETLFNSTQALRGLKCGHVMHLSCFTEYRRESYTCPLCKVSVEDMTDYFTMLDAAIRMQPMPAAYLSTMSNIYCQDCGSTGQVPYHFVGQKCAKCGSYNTREMGRVQVAADP